MKTASKYDAWYETPRGAWIGQKEFSILVKLFTPKHGQTLLDVGCGTGYFSQRFLNLGLDVTGLDSDSAMIEVAKSKNSQVKYIEGDALVLPFADNSFDYCSAITSLCFVSDPKKAISEMLRVSRYGVMLGLLNRHSLLYFKKQNSSGYKGARWDTIAEVKQWSKSLDCEVKITNSYAVWIPSGGILARTLEQIIPNNFPYGSFLAIGIKK